MTASQVSTPPSVTASTAATVPSCKAITSGAPLSSNPLDDHLRIG